MERFNDNITGKILIVDDEEHNRELLHDILAEKGNDVKLAVDGEKALKMITKNYLPDLILLDVMMPGLTGYEVCEALKKDNKTRAIPIIFVTALNSRDDMTKGLEVGGTDFLSKPIHSKEVLLRSRNAIFLKKLFDKEKNYAKKLEELQELNDELIHMIVHDMRNPLSGMMGYIDLLKSQIDEGNNELHQKMVKVIMEQTMRLMEMVSSLLDINKYEKGEMELNKSDVDIIGLAKETTAIFQANEKKIKITLEGNIEEKILNIDKNLIKRVIENLLTNAIKFSDVNSELKIIIDEKDSNITIRIVDKGPGIPKEYREKIFKKFGQVNSRSNGQKYSTGLGLTFCKYAVESHDGKIGVYNNPDKGSTFWFTL